MPSAEKVRFLSHGKVARSCNLGLRILVLFDGRIRVFLRSDPGQLRQDPKEKVQSWFYFVKIRSYPGCISRVGSGESFFLDDRLWFFFLEDRFWVNSNRIRNPGIIPTLAKSIAKGHRQKVAFFCQNKGNCILLQENSAAFRPFISILILNSAEEEW